MWTWDNRHQISDIRHQTGLTKRPAVVVMSDEELEDTERRRSVGDYRCVELRWSAVVLLLVVRRRPNIRDL